MAILRIWDDDIESYSGPYSTLDPYLARDVKEFHQRRPGARAARSACRRRASAGPDSISRGPL